MRYALSMVNINKGCTTFICECILIRRSRSRCGGQKSSNRGRILKKLSTRIAHTPSQSDGLQYKYSCWIIYQRTRRRNWYVKSPKFLPTLKLVLCYSDLITELTPGDASHMEKIESFGTHNEDGDITMEIDDDNRDGKAGKHNG